MKTDQDNILVVVVGPTAVGKTDMAIQLAAHFDTEVVSADSRQVFIETHIGTAKPTVEQLGEIPHHFIGTRSIRVAYDAGEYGREALHLIGKLMVNHKTVILCGGSGLYVKAVCEGFDNMPEIKPGLRDQLMAELKQGGIGQLQLELQEKDPAYFAVVDHNNPHRLVRALEIIRSTGQDVTSYRKANKQIRPFRIVKVGLEVDRAELYDRIDHRVDKMIEQGLMEEARALYPHRHLQALQTVGYQEWFGYFNGVYDSAEAIRLIKRNSRRYAKRQLTWFKRDPEIEWFKPTEWNAILYYLKANGVE